jgi:DNA-binding PadR family transcriptional regulator
MSSGSREATQVDIARFLPLKPKVFMVLLALREDASHGYAIRKDVLERSEGAIELDPGGLYRLIARLESDGLIEPALSRPPVGEDDGRRNYYGLTSVGQAVLAAEARRLARLVELPEVREMAKGAPA